MLSNNPWVWSTFKSTAESSNAVAARRFGSVAVDITPYGRFSIVKGVPLGLAWPPFASVSVFECDIA